MTSPQHAERAHARLGASSADRWMNCTGSVRLSEGLPDTSSPYALEGTAAHELAEMCLERNLNADSFVGTSVSKIEVTEEMAESVQVYLDLVRQLLAAPKAWGQAEGRVSLESMNPPEPMFGTADFVVMQPQTGELHVIDYKHGSGYSVSAIGNPQLRYYALGVFLELEPEDRRRVNRVTMHIVQPRAGGEPVRTDSMPLTELLDFSVDLLAKAEEAISDKATLKAGPWCRFCKAKAICPEQARLAEEVAMTEFTAVGTKVVPPAVESLTVERLTYIMEHADLIEGFLREVRTFLQGSLERGEEVPGWKLVPKRATRKWVDDAQATRWLKERGYKEDEILKQDIKSVAQIEKLVGKGEVPDELVDKSSSGFNLVRDSDPRPAAVVGPEAEFGPALPAPSKSKSAKTRSK